jgi:hypothetical protein
MALFRAGDKLPRVLYATFKSSVAPLCVVNPGTSNILWSMHALLKPIALFHRRSHSLIIVSSRDVHFLKALPNQRQMPRVSSLRHSLVMIDDA